MHPENGNIVMDWLTTPLDNDGDGPKFCELYRMRELYNQIYTAVRQVIFQFNLILI